MLPTILILGPTAGGKTRLAIDLANQLPNCGGGGECISADSMQVYRGMDIGTAKPTKAEQSQAHHHLLDITEPSDDSFSLDRWLELCHQTIADIRARNCFPIVVGGTNLYIQALLKGFIQGPPPDLSRRASLNELPTSELRARLETVDPQAALRIHPNDRKRTIRAIEVFEQSGKPLSEMQTQWNDLAISRSGNLAIEIDQDESQANRQIAKSPDRQMSCPNRQIAKSPNRQMTEPLFIIGLLYSVETINRRINARVKQMIDAGFVDEVRRLRESPGAGGIGRNAREALGYKQILEYLDGNASLDDAIEQIKIRTRRFAKQQRTWLRRFQHDPLRPSVWIQADNLEPQAIVAQALGAISQFLVAGVDSSVCGRAES